MHEKIDEYVRTAVVFTGDAMQLRSFFWKNRTYLVESINMVHRVREGEDWMYFYAVSSGCSSYRLCFSTRTMKWRLLEIYSDG